MVNDRGNLPESSLPFQKMSAPLFANVYGDKVYWVGGSSYWGSLSGGRQATWEGALDDFLKIKDAAGVERFVKKFGPLDLCQHGRPLEHRIPLGPVDARGCAPEIEVMLGDESPKTPVSAEPIARWLYYVSLAASLLAIAAAHHQDALGERSDWDRVLDDPDLGNFRVGTRRAAMEGFVKRHGRKRAELLFLGWACQEWTTSGRVHPSLSDAWDIKEMQFELEGTGFGLLGLQIMVAVTKTGGLTVCDGCKRPYLRRGRKAQAGRRNFCPDCGVRVGNRIRQREFHGKVKSGQPSSKERKR